ncbi:DNA mismatch repair protein MutS [Ramlibacter sp. G-1-2-2]|uniref:DNA mismatch repair protein MutS n=1 Tax=Ramlibacter agri TaxID=2728837 RepID=A0A848H2E0_9BURK|nr:Smr/MutS family protein [Ramlibacter agri]NML43862.1 DNA mismatch repair protein MutS [Ramlibacter agri]
MRKHLAEQERLAKEQAAARALAQKRLDAEQNLFQRAAGAVQRLAPHGRVHHLPEPPAPIPAQRQLDDARVMQESISDEFDASTLLEVDEAMSFRRPGIGIDVARKLRRGHWSIQGEIDLHGLRTDDAREAMAGFLRESVRSGLRCVRVVHGKGLGSPGKTPVLKGKVHGWLVQKNEVLAFVQARGDEGGAGAVVVLLKPGA